MSTDLTGGESAGVPDWMRKASTGGPTQFGNIDGSDLKPPRLKILAGQSPEIIDATPGAAVGQFWMTILNVNLGPAVSGTPILLRKSYQVWAPRMPGSEQKGPLASASNGVTWDVPDQTFEVRYLDNPKKIYKWVLKRTVVETGAHKFGSSQPENPKSKPIATLTYNVLWLIDLPNGEKQLCVFTNARTGVTPTQNFISTTQTKRVPQYFQRYQITSKKLTGPTGDPYFSYDYRYLGNIQNETDGAYAKGLYEQYLKTGFITDMQDEADEINERHANGPRETAPPEDDREDIPF